MTYPNLLIVGPGKTASTWLHDILTNTREINSFTVKETNILFAKDLNKKIKNLNFKKSGTFKYTLDSSVKYFLLNDVVRKNLRKYSPNVKVIIILRDPYSRLKSQLLQYIKIGSISPDYNSIQSQLNTEFEIKYNNYYKNVSSWKNSFETLVLNFEDLKNNKEKFMSNIFNFLELKDGLDSVDFNKVNKSSYPRFIFLSRIKNYLKWYMLKNNNFLSKIIRKFSDPLNKLYIKINLNNSSKNSEIDNLIENAVNKNDQILGVINNSRIFYNNYFK